MRWLSLVMGVGTVAGVPVTAVLDLRIDDPSLNRLEITVDPGFNLAVTDEARVTGNLVADLEIDPALDRVSEMTLRTGSDAEDGVRFSDVEFNNGNFLLSYELRGRELAGGVTTPTPPGVVDPATGEFDASQYEFRLDRGSLNGSATAFGSRTDFDREITPAEPVIGPGEGTGTVVIDRIASSSFQNRYQIALELPVSIGRTVEENGLEVAIAATGTIQATGTVDVAAGPYLAWTVAEGIPGADPQADVNGDGVANVFSWALGLGKDESAQPWLPAATAGGAWELRLPAGGTATPIWIRVSGNLTDWSDLPTTRISGGMNPLPAGTSGVLTVVGSGQTREFFQLFLDDGTSSALSADP